MRRLTAPLVQVLGLTVGFSLLVIPVANAYIDPGSGSFLFQAAMAALLAAGMSVKVFWRRIKGLFGSGPADDTHDGQA